MEQEIIKHLKEKHNPEVILLAGSRAKGTEKQGSDWDLFILSPQAGKGEFEEFNGELLDVTFKSWPEATKPLNIPSGPLWPVKVLLDNSGKKLSELLKITEEAFGKGPLDLYKNSSIERFEKLSSWQKKIIKHQNEPMIEFFYAGVFYEFAIRAWFELQNKWSLSPKEALVVIRDKDDGFYNLLNDFVSVSSTERPDIIRQVMERLNSILAEFVSS